MLLSRKALSNIKGLTSFLQRRLPQRLLDAEDEYVLYGTGVSPQIKGLLVAGNFVDSLSVSSKLSIKILQDISLLEDTYKRIATAIILRPSMYWGLFTEVASGSGEYNLPQGVTFVNNQLYMWGIPVGKTTGLHHGDYIVGDLNNGAEIYQQEAMRLEFFEKD